MQLEPLQGLGSPSLGTPSHCKRLSINYKPIPVTDVQDPVLIGRSCKAT